jgi:hypothetical protein
MVARILPGAYAQYRFNGMPKGKFRRTQLGRKIGGDRPIEIQQKIVSRL